MSIHARFPIVLILIVLLVAGLAPAAQAAPTTLTVTFAGTGAGTVTSSTGFSCTATCTNNVPGNPPAATLTATAAVGSTFSGWSGGGCSGTGTCAPTLTKGAAHNVTATFVLTTYTLSVTPAGTGSGTITSSPAGISCGVACSASFGAGASVTLTATAATGSTFGGWSGSGCSGTGTCIVTMSAARSVTATFTLNSYTLTVNRTGAGAGTVTSNVGGIDCGATCGVSLTHGTVVTLTATASPGSTFAGWAGGGCSGTGSCVVTMTGATTVTATFNSASNPVLTVSKSGTGSGTVTSTPAGIDCGATCSGSFSPGTVDLSATASPGSTFTGWSGGGCSGTGTCAVTLSADTNVTATFTLNSYLLTVSKSGSGSGAVTSVPLGINCGGMCAASYDHGTAVALTAAASPGSVFTGWSGAGCSGTGTCNVTMNAAKSVSATFVLQRALTVSKSGTGSGTVTSVPAGIDCGADCSESYLDGDVVTLSATPAADSDFSGWSGAGCSGTGSCVVTMDAARSVTASFALHQHTLSVSRTGAGTGTVTSIPAGIDCGANCSALFDQGSSVALVPTADPGSTFSGWAGACTGTGACNVAIDDDRAVIATFVLVPRTLTVGDAGTGSGSVTSTPAGIDCGATCSAQFENGSLVSLTATPSVGSTFTGWTGACSGTGTCNLTMDADKAVTANFALIPRTLSVSSLGVGTGTITSAPAGISCGATCSAQFDHGTGVILSAAASPGSTFTGWSGDCSGTDPCVVPMTADASVVATFVLTPRTLSVSTSGSGNGTVASSPPGISCGFTCTAQFENGSVVTLTANAATGSTFAGWSGSGCSGTGTCTVTMEAAKSVTAAFTLNQYALSVSTAGIGSGSVDSNPSGIACGATCSADFGYATQVLLVASPAPGSTFTGWSGAGCSGTGACNVTMNAAASVTATFVLVPRTLVVTKAGAGSGTVTSSPAGIDCGSTCGVQFEDGTSVTLTANPATGSTFAGWSGSGCSGTGTCVVTMDGAKSVTATFTLIDRTLTVTPAGAGSGTVSSAPAGISCGATCSDTFVNGTQVILTASAAPGSTFSGWTGACLGTAPCVLTLTTDTAVTAHFIVTPRDLSVSVGGTGSGTVTSAPMGVSCGPYCDVQFEDGDIVTLTATPAANSAFSGWSGSGCSGSGTCQVTMDAAKSVTATFVLVEHTITVSKAGAGSGTVLSVPGGILCGATCAGDFDDGTELTLVAIADAGSTFAGWSGAGCSGSGFCEFSATADTVATATFAAAYQPDGMVRKTGAAAFLGDGTINLTGAGQTAAASVKRGKSVSFELRVANDGSVADTFTVQAGNKQKPFSVKYSVGGTDVTASVVAGTYSTASLAPGADTTVTAVVKASRRAKIGTSKTFLVTFTSSTAATAKDVVGMKVKAKR